MEQREEDQFPERCFVGRSKEVTRNWKEEGVEYVSGWAGCQQ